MSRPKIKNKKKKISITLDDNIIDLLSNIDNKSKLINKLLIDELMSTSKLESINCVYDNNNNLTRIYKKITYVKDM